MQRINLWGNLVELDEKATRRWYGSAVPWGCDCGHCRNFLTLAKERRLPGKILETLDIFGILPENATYVCEIYPEGKGHCYQFSYRLSGNILEESAETKQSWGEV